MLHPPSWRIRLAHLVSQLLRVGLLAACLALVASHPTTAPQSQHQTSSQADDLSEPEQQAQWAWAYLSGDGVPLDEEAALHWAAKSAEHGHPDGLFVLATIYIEGRGVPKQPEKALPLIERAVALGHPTSINALGWMYLWGIGVKGDVDKAISLLRQAEALGEPWASFNLGYAHQGGFGVQKDLDMAHEYFERAARQGVSEAYSALGDYYRSDMKNTGEPNWIEAYKWYWLGAEHGDISAATAVKGMEIHLDPQQREAAEMAAMRWLDTVNR
ncbi:MAG: tetratricopeptide repeat protein [Candidatus Sericytochromatia bacterium]